MRGRLADPLPWMRSWGGVTGQGGLFADLPVQFEAPPPKALWPQEGPETGVDLQADPLG
jgi:hypothetical protein